MKDVWIYSYLADEVERHRAREDYNGYEACENVYVLPAGSLLGNPAQYEYCIRIGSTRAFGDGRHPTTSLCLKTLHVCLSSIGEKSRERMTMLDAGTGTGILSILAWKMGVRRCDSVDLAEEAVEEASENAAINGCGGIRFHPGDVASYAAGKTYDLITANLLPDVIRLALPVLARALKPSGRLLLSGIGNDSDREMQNLFSRLNLDMRSRDMEGGWYCYLLVLKKRPPGINRG